MMRDQDAAQARSNAYSLFGRLFIGGVTADLVRFVQAIPELAAPLSGAATADLNAAAQSGSASPFVYGDQAEAEHYALFGLNVFPFQSIFLDPQALLGGGVTDGVLAFSRQVGFEMPLDADGVDHVGVELLLLAYLSGAEADAWQDQLAKEAQRMRLLQRRFLDEHLLRWLPPLVCAIRQQEIPFYRALADLTLKLVLAHRSVLPAGVLARAEALLPPAPALLDDQQAGLKEIVDYFLTPAYSACYLSREDVARLARKHRLPRGFGSRRQMLTSLLRVAVDYDRLPNVLRDLQVLLDGWRSFYETCETSSSPLSGIAVAWRERLMVTQDLLQRLQASVRQIQTPEPDAMLSL